MPRRFSAVALASLVALSGAAQAGPLDPAAFASLGTLDLTARAFSYSLTTTGGRAPTITGNGVTFTGVVVDGVAVFAFDRVTIRAGATLQGIQAFGSLPVAILSRSTMDVAGVVDVSGFSYIGGAGAGFAGFGGNGSVGFTPTGTYSSGGGGGSFGGVGGRGADATLPDGSKVPGGAGGATYGDLGVRLQGGSSGAPGGFGSANMSGGGGGGAIELGAIGSLSISGAVNAYGGDAFSTGAGGGSGGGIFLHAATLSVAGSLDVSGGSGGQGIPGTGIDSVAGGGGGGGGRILAMSGDASFAPGRLNLRGGTGRSSYPDATAVGGNGSAGEFRFVPAAAVPEPSSLVLCTVAALGGLSLAAVRRRPAA